jgi:8-oxo-dGTP pyrophosphatase MutT (NUDIX family)
MSENAQSITYHAAGGVVVDESRAHVLVLIRPARDEIRLPKGHMEPGESPQETALREVREEAGYADLEILADLGEQMVAFAHEERAILRIEHYYLMEIRSRQEIERPDGDTAQFFTYWATWQEAGQSLTFAAEQEWLQRAQTALAHHHDA